MIFAGRKPQVLLCLGHVFTDSFSGYIQVAKIAGSRDAAIFRQFFQLFQDGLFLSGPGFRITAGTEYIINIVPDNDGCGQFILLVRMLVCVPAKIVFSWQGIFIYAGRQTITFRIKHLHTL